MSIYEAESDRLWLQTMTIDHLPRYHEILVSLGAKLLSPRTPPKDLEASRIDIAKRLKSSEDPWKEYYAVILRPSSENKEAKMIGLIGTPRFEPGRGVEVGYQLDPDYFGKGYMTEALDTFLTLYWSVEREDEWNTVRAHVRVGNLASEKVLERAGFHKGGLLEYERPWYEEETDEKSYVSEWFLEKSLWNARKQGVNRRE